MELQAAVAVGLERDVVGVRPALTQPPDSGDAGAVAAVELECDALGRHGDVRLVDDREAAVVRVYRVFLADGACLTLRRAALLAARLPRLGGAMPLLLRFRPGNAGPVLLRIRLGPERDRVQARHLQLLAVTAALGVVDLDRI